MPFILPSELSEKEVFPGYRGRFVHTDKLTLVYWTIAVDAPLPEHSHPHEQVSNLISGEYELTIEGQSRVLRAGELAVIPSGSLHSGRSLSPCEIIDIFHPIREDYH